MGIEDLLQKLRDDAANIDAINIRAVDLAIVGGRLSVQLELSYERDGQVLAFESAPSRLTEGDTLRLHLPLEVHID